MRENANMPTSKRATVSPASTPRATGPLHREIDMGPFGLAAEGMGADEHEAACIEADAEAFEMTGQIAGDGFEEKSV